jgi:hypothetical protein
MSRAYNIPREPEKCPVVDMKRRIYLALGVEFIFEVGHAFPALMLLGELRQGMVAL